MTAVGSSRLSLSTSLAAALRDRAVAWLYCHRSDKDLSMTRRAAAHTLFVATVLLAVAFPIWMLLSPDDHPNLNRDARRLGAYFAAKELCKLKSPAGGVDGVVGQYDFYPPATQAFERALAATQNKEEDRIALLAKADVATYCKLVGRELPWTAPSD